MSSYKPILALVFAFCFLLSLQAQTYNMTDGITEVTCSGTFYDPQGSSVYTDFNGSYTMTFQSDNGTQLQFDFTEFSTSEANDYLEIYDGQTTGASLLGSYSQSGSPGTITSTGEYLTFVWVTDNNYDGDAGWAASISCTPVPSNDDCANAISLPCGTTDMSGTSINTTSQANGTGCSLSDYGVWYHFTGDGIETTISSTSASGFDHEMAISEGACGSLTSVSCQDSDFDGGTESHTLTPTNGTDYYVYIAYYGTGTTTGDFTISRSCACVADMSMAANEPAASSVCAGTTKHPIQSFSLAVAAGCDGELTNLSFTTSGTYAETDVERYQLWYNGSNDLSSATQLGWDLASSGGAGTRSFSPFTSPVLTGGNNWYFWITADISSSAAENNTIAVDAISPGDITSTHNITGNSNAGGTQTINHVTAPGGITSDSPQCSGTGVTFSQGSCPEGTCYWVSSGTGTETSDASATYTSSTAMGSYDVWVRSYDGNCWSESVTANGIVTDAPVLISGPSDVSISTGDNHSFSMSASNSPDTYVWEVSTDGGSSWTALIDGGVYSNTNSSDLQITSATIDMDGNQYRAMASNSCGSTGYTSVATLNVSTCLPTYSSGGSTDCMTHVVLETLDDVPPANNSPYYFDQSATQNAVPDLEPSLTYTIDISVDAEASQYTRIWIDFDQNGVFESDESFSSDSNLGSAGTESLNFTVPGGALSGTTTMRIRGGDDSAIPADAACGASNSSWGQALDYDVNILPPSNMSFVSCTATQNNTGDISIGDINQEILCIQVVTTGVLNPLNLSAITLRTDGTDAYSTDISNANLWYTGTSPSFSSSAQYNSTIVSPPAPGVDMSFTDSQELEPGTNYFWLTYDIPSGAVSGNVADAILQAITVEGSTETPTTSAPAGNRKIIAGCYHRITLMDDWGPWDASNTITVQVDGVDRLTDISLTSGTSETYEFIAQTGETISTIYSGSTEPEDNSYLITNPNGAYIASSGEAQTIPQNISATADCDAIKEFTMNGDTYQSGEACFIITEDKTSQTGSVWSNYKMDLTHDFTIEFELYLGDDSGGADGVVFALQGDCASSGGDGSSLGYGGISNSVAVEFDTYDNGSNGDLFNDHLAIISDGSTSHSWSSNLAGPIDAGELEDDVWHSAVVSWDASANTLSVDLDGSQVLSYTGDIVTDQMNGNSQAFWGFTGGTGMYHNLQKVCVNTYPQNSMELSDMNICSGCSVDVQVASGANSYTWTPDNGSISDPAVYNPTLSPAVTTDYTVMVEDGCGNMLTDKFTVFVGSLPITLINFNANCYGKMTELTWQTASEKNNAFFIIESSLDMKDFVSVARINGSGTVNELTEYCHLLPSEKGSVYYRLIQVDEDFEQKEVSLISVNCESSDEVHEPEIFPNPFTDKLYVITELDSGSSLNIQIYNETGKMVKHMRINNPEGRTRFSLNMENLPEGLYLINLNSKNLHYSTKLLKSHR